jgi:cobalt-zinc-cadmium efflux system outer membrane protein
LPVALSMVTVTRAMSDRGLASGVEADVAEALSIRSVQARILADGRHVQAQVAFTLALSADPARPLDASGDLVPLSGVADAARALLGAERPEVRALEEDRRSWQARASTYRRARVPNILLSTFVQNDGFDERVIGFGIGIPIPFPQPVGRTHAGEIAESDAMANRAETEVARLRLTIKASTLRALSEYEARIKERDAASADRVDRAGKTLQSIGQEVGAGRLALRDAIVTQRTLVDFLFDYVSVQHAACTASVDLARSAGVPFERGGL